MDALFETIYTQSFAYFNSTFIKMQNQIDYFISAIDSIYFQDEELNELNLLEQEMKGRVASRLRDIEGLMDSSDSYSTTSYDDEEVDHSNSSRGNSCHDNDHGNVIGDKETNVLHAEKGEDVNTIVKTASQEARSKWKELSEGTCVVSETLFVIECFLI